MCGITGWLDTRTTTLDEDIDQVLARMRDSLTHRGPDDFGSWFTESGRVALANRRLSILDLTEHGRQPMVSETADVVLTYNGEIFNHLELRSELEGLGHRFKSTCDTETVLYAFQEWGIDCISRFKGQFAFAAWDGRSRTLHLVRDRVGLQPLYFYSADDLLVFGSELRAVLEHPSVTPEINVGALYQYYVLHSPAPPFTLLKDVYVVPAGSYVRCRLGETPQLMRYWSILDEVGKQDLTRKSADEIADTVRETLIQAVERRLMSDRPIGLFLSGGLDSSSILACMATSGATDLQSFSIGSADESPGRTADEFRYARIVAETYGSKHTMLRANSARVMEFLSFCDQPPQSLVEYWIWEMAEAAGDAGVRVILHGEGADELFFGYSFHWTVLAERRRITDHPERAFDSPIDTGIPVAQWESPSGEWDREALGDLAFWGGGVHPMFEYNSEKYFSPDLVAGRLQSGRRLDVSRYRPMSNETEVLSFIQACYAETRASHADLDFRHKMQYLEFIHKLPEVLLRRSERSTMKHSVEMRLPFLDEDMISLAVNLPLSSLRQSGQVKHPLRQAMRGLVPERIRTRSKEFFGSSFLDANRKWLQQSEWFHHYALESKFADLDFIPRTYIRKRYEALRDNGTEFETLLWKQAFTAIWFDRYVSR
jgi:asparagine synthase (glutamine-hydrolysing)